MTSLEQAIEIVSSHMREAQRHLLEAGHKYPSVTLMLDGPDGKNFYAAGNSLGFFGITPMDAARQVPVPKKRIDELRAESGAIGKERGEGFNLHGNG